LIAAMLRHLRSRAEAESPACDPAQGGTARVVDAALPPVLDEAVTMIDWPRVHEVFSKHPELVQKLPIMALENHQHTPRAIRAAAAGRRYGELAALSRTLGEVAGDFRALRLMEEAWQVESASTEHSPAVCAMAERLAASADQFLAELAAHYSLDG